MGMCAETRHVSPVLLEFAAPGVPENIHSVSCSLYSKQRQSRYTYSPSSRAAPISLRNFSFEEIVEPEPIFHFPALKTERFSRKILFLISPLKRGSYMQSSRCFLERDYRLVSRLQICFRCGC